MLRTFLTAGIVVAAAGSTANAVIIVNDNFDGYANQAAFEAVWAPVNTTLELSTAAPSSAPNSARAPGSTTLSYRNRRTHAETSTFSTSGNLGIGDQIIWSFDFKQPSVSPSRNYANLQDSTAPSATNQLVSMGNNNTLLATADGGNYLHARILGYSPPADDPDGGPGNSLTASGAYFKLNDFGVGIRPSAGTDENWYNLKVIISTNDGLSTDYDFYVNGQLAERVHNVGTTASIRSFDNINIGSGVTNGGNEAFFDNMYLEYVQVPEPTSLALLGLGAIGLLGRRRRID